MRLRGVVYAKTRCPLVHGKIEVPILFSCNGENVEGNTLKLEDFIPAEVVEVVKKVGSFLVKFASRELRKVNVTEVPDTDEIVATVSSDVVKERRLFDRFSFCLGDSNEFLIQGLDLKSFIVNISLNGICLFVPKKELKISAGDSVVLNGRGKVLTFQVKRVKEMDKGIFLGGEIKRSNFNVMKFIVTNYVKQVREILSQNA